MRAGTGGGLGGEGIEEEASLGAICSTGRAGTEGAGAAGGGVRGAGGASGAGGGVRGASGAGGGGVACTGAMGAGAGTASEAMRSVAARLSSSARVARPASLADSTARFSQTMASYRSPCFQSADPVVRPHATSSESSSCGEGNPVGIAVPHLTPSPRRVSVRGQPCWQWYRQQIPVSWAATRRACRRPSQPAVAREG